MRKGLLGTAALLAASRLSAAGPPQVPPAAPPAPFAVPAETATALPPAVEQPPAGTQPETPAARLARFVIDFSLRRDGHHTYRGAYCVRRFVEPS